MSDLKNSSFVLLIFLIMSSLTNNVITYDMSGSIMIPGRGDRVLFATSYTPHDPVVILNNSDFVSQGWPGNGTVGNPYVIGNLSITDQLDCIWISNTTLYFEIRTCLISASSFSEHHGIVLDNVTHGMIKDCIVENHYFGILLSHSSSIILINNTVSDCLLGFLLFYSTCTMRNNSASDNQIGYQLSGASFCNLTDNHASENLQGFSLFRSNSSLLVNNTADDNYGENFQLQESLSCTLTNNTGRGNGLSIIGLSMSHWLHNISGNTINGRFLGYFKSVSNMTIIGEQYNQIVLVNCSHVTLKNGMFNSTTTGVLLGYCTSCTVTNITSINSNQDGFNILFSSKCVLSNNTSTSSLDDGFHLSDSPNCTLTNNTATINSMMGFFLNNCSSSTLTNNIAMNNGIVGFTFESSSYYILTNNTAHDTGIGFKFFESDLCVLTNNTASENYFGFFFDSTNSSLLTENTARNNFLGIVLTYSCTDNLLFLNHFSSNSEHNAFDDGFSNDWDNGVYGNFWDDYDGVGPYNIFGSAGSVDNYPDGMITTEPTTTTTTTITTTSTTTTTPVGEPWFPVDLLITGISIVSATIISVVLILIVRTRRAAKTTGT